MNASALAASVASIGLVAAVGACGSSASTAQPSSSRATRASTAPAAPTSASAGVPAGYQRIGGAAQGLSLAVPSSWVTVNFARQTIQQGITRIGLHGASQATLTQLLQGLQKLHAVYAVDVNSTYSSPGHFATNLNAYCTTSGVTESGSASVPLVRQLAAAELQQRLGAQQLHQADVEVGGIPGVRTSYTLSTSAAGTLHSAQLEVLPKPDRACFVTLTAAGRIPRAVLARIATSVRYP